MGGGFTVVVRGSWARVYEMIFSILTGSNHCTFVLSEGGFTEWPPKSLKNNNLEGLLSESLP